MATKLTNWKREQIAKEVLRHRFSDAVEKLVADRAALAERVYNDVYPKAMREKMAALPAGWLNEDYDIGVQFGDAGRGYVNLSFSGAFWGELSNARPAKPTEKVRRRILHKHNQGCVKVYEAGHRLAAEFDALEARMADLTAQYNEAKTQLNSALNSASTAGKLITLWPEIKPFVEKHAEAPAALPAIRTSELNALLDLPVSEAA